MKNKKKQENKMLPKSYIYDLCDALLNTGGKYNACKSGTVEIKATNGVYSGILKHRHNGSILIEVSITVYCVVAYIVIAGGTMSIIYNNLLPDEIRGLNRLGAVRGVNGYKVEELSE